MSDSVEHKSKIRISQHPWRRYFARTIDISVISSLILFPYMQLSGRFNYPFFERILSVLIVMLLLFIIETMMITSVGTTLGKWILNIKDSDIKPVIIQRYLLLNQNIFREVSFLNKFVYSLTPKMYLSAVWASLFINKKKYIRVPFVKYPKKRINFIKYITVLAKIKREFNLSDKDLKSNKDFLFQYIDNHKMEVFSYYGMSKKDWLEHDLNFDDIKIYGNRPVIEYSKGLDAWLG
jgi:hypothetical protein